MEGTDMRGSIVESAEMLDTREEGEGASAGELPARSDGEGCRLEALLPHRTARDAAGLRSCAVRLERAALVELIVLSLHVNSSRPLASSASLAHVFLHRVEVQHVL
eukprot:748319-Hanusia_phi.AAC.5